MARITRATAAKQASSAAPSQNPPSKATVAKRANANSVSKKSASLKKLRSDRDVDDSESAPGTGLGDGLQASSADVSNLKEEEVKEAANVGKKRKRPVEDNIEDEYEELPHNLGRIPKAKKGQIKEEAVNSTESSPTKRNRQEALVKMEHHDWKDDNATEQRSVSKRSPPKKKTESIGNGEPASGKKPKTAGTPRKMKPRKTNEYGLTPGSSPFPDYPHPTPEECYEVHRVLKAHHPECHGRPNSIPPPSHIVAGCGQVPSILDALIRTLLSAATTSKNSNSAYQGMVARYGNTEKGVGKGSVDYNAVRLAPQSDLEAAIASGGLANAKSKNIKTILDMVYEENQERRKAHLASQSNHEPAAAPKGANVETEEQKVAEIALAEEDVLSLDHYYTLPTYDAIFTFVKYPGIGVKTAACTALFCMQRDCFAVDTHVFRLAQWLGWVPSDNKKVNRDTTFSHLEVRIPDKLKFDLHQLFIKHGKTCPRCRASTGESSARWAEGCVIDHLVQRSGPRKGGAGSPVKRQGSKASASKKSKKKAKDTDEEDEDNEMSVPSDDDQDDEEPSMPDLDDDEEYKSPLKTIKKTPESHSTKRNTHKLSESLSVTTPLKKASSKKAINTPAKAVKRASRVSN